MSAADNAPRKVGRPKTATKYVETINRGNDLIAGRVEEIIEAKINAALGTGRGPIRIRYRPSWLHPEAPKDVILNRPDIAPHPIVLFEADVTHPEPNARAQDDLLSRVMGRPPHVVEMPDLNEAARLSPALAARLRRVAAEYAGEQLEATEPE